MDAEQIIVLLFAFLIMILSVQMPIDRCIQINTIGFRDTEQVIVLLFAFQDIIGQCIFPETEVAPTDKLGKIRLHKTFMGKSRLSR